MIEFGAVPTLTNIAIFAATAAVVWFAGSRVAKTANAISDRTGLGQALVGMILLAGITSLPEIGVTVSSAAVGAAELAVNNLFGSIALQVVILALADYVIGRRALTSELPDSTVILQGALNVLLLSMVTAGMVVGDFPIIGIGAWAWLSLAGYLFCVWVLTQARQTRRWRVTQGGTFDHRVEEQQDRAEHKASQHLRDRPLGWLVAETAALGLAILVAGFILSQTGVALADQSGIGGSLMGFAFLALATSLPELSATMSAAREGLYTLALSDIFGTNLINVGLVFLVDAAAPGAPVLSAVGDFATFGALLAIAVTAIFMVGMIERRDATVARLGLDSIAVCLIYGAGLVVLFFLR